ncbi:MAG: GLUG motif-containing protein [Planctomycetota bacterium]|jgi:hypothetical protein
MFSLSNTLGLSGPRKQNAELTASLLILFVLCFFSLPAHAQYGGGTGTENDPYLIRTAEQMNEIGAEPDDWNKHFKLTADVNMSEFTWTENNTIGTAALESFSGVFDGNDHEILNFSLTSTRQSYTGLFGYVTGQIKDLGLIDANIFAQGNSVGSLAGRLGQGIIIGCYAKGVSVSGSRNIGGLVGWNAGRILNCYSSGSVFGDAYVGGLAGQIGDGIVRQSYSKADVSGNSNIGGLVGRTGQETSVVSDCYATGSVRGGTYAGGLVGQVERGAAHKCYSTGSVSGSQYVGGFAGYMRVLGTISHCFWDTQTSGQLTSADGTGKTTAEMQMISTFTAAGWDFWNIWEICEGMNYPVLQWQIPICDYLCPDGVDFIDYAFFTSHWRDEMCNPANYYCQGTDLDHSGSVGFDDLEIFADHWLEGIP